MPDNVVLHVYHSGDEGNDASDDEKPIAVPKRFRGPTSGCWKLLAINTVVKWSFQRTFLWQVEVGNSERSISNPANSMTNSFPVLDSFKNLSRE